MCLYHHVLGVMPTCPHTPEPSCDPIPQGHLCATHLSALFQQVLELGPELPAQDPLELQWQCLARLQ